MAYSQGGGKKKVCYYYDGEWPRSLQQGCGEGAAGRSRGSGYLGWLPAGTRTRPSLAVVSRGHAPSLVSGPLLGHAQVWVALSRTCPRGTPVATRGLTAQSRRSGAPPPRPRPLPRSLGSPPPSRPRSVCSALSASPRTPPPGWGCGGVPAGWGPSSQSGAVSLVFCVDSIPPLCSLGSPSATFSGFK